MYDYPTPTYDPSEIDTPSDMSPETIVGGPLTGIPTEGTGLKGKAYANGDSIWNIGQLMEVIATSAPVAEFTSSEVSYGGRSSDTTIAEFLGEDAASLTGDGSVEMGPSGISLKGYMYIPAGVHEIGVTSDDGFVLSIGGEIFSAYSGGRAADTTARVSEFEGGVYEVELFYFDGGGSMSLQLEMDGLPIDESAFYQDPQDIIDNPADAPLIPVEDYHPSMTLGEAAIDNPETIEGTDAAEVIDALGGDDVVNAGGGDDTVYGGYGDDNIDGGDGNDVLIGGRGSDWVKGGAGDDTIVSRSDAGEQKIGQIVVGNVTRPDNGEVNYDRQKLAGWEKQALVADDILEGGEGKDVFLFTPLINAKLEIIQKHVRADGTINWAGVAGENTYVHDHWVDSFGIDVIADFNAEEDQIVIAGHTAEICDVSYRDTDGDGDLETIITVWSNQSGPCVATGNATCHCASDNARAGGAHDQDLLGQIIVHGDLVEEKDILVDAGVTYGVVETYAEVVEALFPEGETKVTEIDGETVYGYDTRSEDGSYGPITGEPEKFIDNPFMTQAEAGFADPTPMAEVELTRDPFEQLTLTPTAGQTITGNGGANTLAPDTPDEGPGLPGALGYWSLAAGDNGAYADGRGERGDIKTYTLYENQALLNTAASTAGPDGTPDSAIYFNGEDSFAYLEHDPAYQVTQGTIALWVRADNLDDEGAIVTKDQRNTGDGGHFRLVQEEDGKLFMRFAPGNGESNKEWVTKAPVLDEGVWHHIAVSFTEDGVTVYVDGDAIGNNQWQAVSGDVPNPGVYGEAYILQNEEPWVFGADQRATELNETAAQFAADDEDLDDAFEGAISGFGIWGGFEKTDALTEAEINTLIDDGPGTALTKPSGPQPMLAGDDTIQGLGGADKIDGGAGDDDLEGNNGNDTIHGNYGDDHLKGGDGNDFLDGGRGSDLLEGGDGNDILLSGADMGEQRIGQLVIGENSRQLDQYEDPSVDPEYLKLVDWIDQPLIADDILVGGAGRDEFRFETYINGKLDILLEHTMPNRMIHWHGVAGENKYLHDHWVDGFGIDIIADYNADEDIISVKGHTTEVKVDYKAIDTNDDGVNDSVVSIITAYSQQGNGGGAHDEDYLGYIVVYGDLVEEGDIITDAAVHYGIVDTVDELQEALAPTGETRTKTLPDGTELFGIDSRDVEGNPIENDPEAYSENPWLGQVALDAQGIDPSTAPGMVLYYNAGTFDGSGGYEIPHASGQSPQEGTLALRFTADDVSGDKALFSKDHSGYKDGGHLTAYISNGRVKVRIQDTNSDQFLQTDRVIEEGETYDIAFTFDGDGIALYLDGVLVDTGDAMPNGMQGNIEDTMIGASVRQRRDDDDRADWFFDGEIEQLSLLDRSIDQVEAILLHEGGSDPSSIGVGGASPTVPDTPDTPDTPTNDEPDPDPETGNTDPDPDPETDPETDPDPGTDPDTAEDDPEVPTPEDEMAVALEIGTVSVEQMNGAQWHTVTFSEAIEDARVVMGPLTFNGGQAATVRVRDVTDTGFQFQIDEWNYLDGYHLTESVSWIAMTEGTHTLASGQVVSAGRTTAQHENEVSVSISGFDDGPAVFTQVSSYNGDDAVTTRITDTGLGGFSFEMQEEEASGGMHAEESVDWIALSYGTSGPIDVGNLAAVDHTWSAFGYDDVEGDVALLAAMQTMNGPDTATLRFDGIDENSARVRVHEETSRDAEIRHTDEEVAFLSASEGRYELL